jgi:uncharacterized membrane protein YbhN (UPF0104 family)
MIDRIKKYWPFIKIFIWILVAFAVGFQFWRILHLEALKDPEGKHNSLTLLLQQLQNVSLSGVFLCSLLYIVGIGFSGWFWADLLNDIKQPISLPFGLRCFYIAQLGKYVPGKGLALFLRINSAMKENVSIAAGVVTSIYEVLFTMATGATLAVLLGFLSPDTSTTQIAAAAFLMIVTGIPIMPGVFPFIVRKLGKRFLPADQFLILPGTFRSFFRGLLFSVLCWCFLGASLMVLWQAMDTSVNGMTFSRFIWCTGCVTLSNVAGFVASTPGGLGVREQILQIMMAATLGPKAVTAAILLRVIWTASEIVTAFGFYWIKPQATDRKNIADTFQPVSTQANQP